MLRSIKYLLLLALVLVECSVSHSLYVKYGPKNGASIVRNLVHQSNWASVGTVSTNSKIRGFPMVNVISIDDSTLNGTSTGKIHFLLTDLDFTGPDWRALNKVTFLFTEEQNKNCTQRGVDPMEPICARAIISGKVIEMDPNSPEYAVALTAFINRHPAAVNWIAAHKFYLCELDIENIFVMYTYGPPHEAAVAEYYKVTIDSKGEASTDIGTESF